MEGLKTEAENRSRVEWTFHNPYNYTKRLIDDPLIFYRTKRGVNYQVIQILTGHGIFNWYRHRIGKETHISCWNCGAILDDAEHLNMRVAIFLHHIDHYITFKS
jgi:hypothetical protein